MVEGKRAERASAQTCAQAADAYIAAHASGWKSAKHGQQWRSTLDTYAAPILGHLLVRQIELRHILAVLSPIWESKTETASRLRNRLELVLDWATAHGQREGLNPARWRGHLDKLLPKPSKVTRTQHHAALPVGELGAFMANLRQQQGMAALALEFAILTAARSGEVRGATWGEIDLASGVWVIPGERMKAGRDHRVPSQALRWRCWPGCPGWRAVIWCFKPHAGGHCLTRDCQNSCAAWGCRRCLTGSARLSAIGWQSAPPTLATWQKWPWRTRWATRSKPPTDAATCSRSAAG